MTNMKHIATGRGRRQDRQREATERVTAWRALSIADRLQSLTTRRGESNREYLRLTAAHAKTNKTAKTDKKTS